MASVFLVRPFQEAWEGIKGYASTIKHIFKGEFSEAWDTFKDTTVNLITSSVRLPLEAGAIALHTIVGVYDTLRGDLDVRKLNAEEIDYLRGIYGDSIDYSEIRIHTGGVKQRLGMRANVIGNDIFMPKTNPQGEAIFNSDGTMTPEGLELLGHEVAHVHQYQNDGTSYIGESLLGQINHTVFDKWIPTGAPDPYDWRDDVIAGTEYEDLGPEQQAEVAEMIGIALSLNAGQTNPPRDPAIPFTEDNLAEAMGYPDATRLPPGVYDIFVRAHDQLRR